MEFVLATNKTAHCKRARRRSVGTASYSQREGVGAIDGRELLQRREGMHSDAAAQHSNHIETVARCDVRYGKRRAHCDVLNRVEFRNDDLRPFRKKEKAAIGGSHNELLVPRV